MQSERQNVMRMDSRKMRHRAVADDGIVADDDFAVLGGPHVHFDFDRAERDRGPERGQRVFGCDGVESAVRADAGVSQDGIAWREQEGIIGHDGGILIV